MAINDIFRVTLMQRLHQQQVFNVLHFRSTEESSGNSQALANNINTGLMTSIRSFQSAELQWEGISVQIIRPTAEDPFLLTITGITGAVAGEALPGTVAAVLGLRTGLAGRSNRGRMYIAGVPETNSQGGKLITAGFSALTVIGNSILSRHKVGGATYTGWEQIVWSRLREVQYPSPSTLPGGTISAVQPRDILGTMRSRKIGIGN